MAEAETAFCHANMKTEKKLRNSVDESFTQSLVSDDDL